MTIPEAEQYIRENKGALIKSIRNRTYQPLPVLRKEIPKPGGGVRLLGIPTVIDRVIQQAISQILTPIFDKEFHDSSFGFRPNRSAHMALERGLQYLNEGYDWIVDIDLEKFFDTVNHDRVMNLVSRKVDDGDVISLVRKYLVSGVMLNELDQELDKRGLRFVRYADDCIIFVKSEFSARRVMRSITRYMEETLGLKVNATKSKVTKPINPEFKYLGFGFYYAYQEEQYKAKPHAISIERFKYKLRHLSRKNWSVSMEHRITRLNQTIRGWGNYFKIGSMYTVLRNISAHLRYRLRMCIWHQWKTGKKRVQSLIKLRMSPYEAYKNGHSSKGAASIARSWVMCTTVTNKVLATKGLISPDEYYLKRIHVI